MDGRLMLVAYEVWTKILVSLVTDVYLHICVLRHLPFFFFQCTVILQKKIHEKYKNCY